MRTIRYILLKTAEEYRDKKAIIAMILGKTSCKATNIHSIFSNRQAACAALKAL